MCYLLLLQYLKKYITLIRLRIYIDVPDKDQLLIMK